MSAAIADIRLLNRRIRPFTSLSIAIAIAAAALTAFPRSPAGITEVAFFVVAPWFVIVVALNGRLFFAFTARERVTALSYGIVAAAALYLADVLIHLIALGPVQVHWAPAPVHLAILACTAALNETVIVQLGIQWRIRGWGGVIVAALFFWLIHVSLNPIFLAAGIAFAVLQYVTGRPGASFIAHVLYNGLISTVPPSPT